MVKSPIKVLVRTRPTPNFAVKTIDIDQQAGQVKVNVPKNETQGYVNHQQENWSFKFDQVLQNTSQQAVYEASAKDILQSALQGYSGTVLCYGQTGAGKTFTMNGEPLKLENKGIIPRTIRALFKEIKKRSHQDITVKVSYVEIYNETISDLLDPDSDASIAINEDAKKGTTLKGTTYKTCRQEKQAVKCLLKGNANRTVSANALNPDSSRSHAIFTIYLQMRSTTPSHEKIIYSKINLVDLAGSERTKKTKSEGRTLVEANYINKSLFFLEQMVTAFSEKQRDHVPYRHSKLTHLLKDSIGGNSKTLMIANILPEQAHLEETISTLRFATRMMKVSNEAQINVKLDPQALIKKYENEIQQLKRELVTQSVFGNKSPFPYDRATQEESELNYKTAKSYLQGEIEEIEIHTISHAQALFKQLRRAHNDLSKKTKKKKAIKAPENPENLSISNRAKPRENCELKVIENFQPSEDFIHIPKSPNKIKYIKTSFDKNLTEDDIKNLTTNMSTIGDESTEVLHVEQSTQQDSESKSYYVSSIHRINDLEKTQTFSQSNIDDDGEAREDIKSYKVSGKRYHQVIPSKQSAGSKEDLQELTQKAIETKSLQYLQDMTPRSFATDFIRTENDIKNPRRKLKPEVEKIQELKVTLNLINKSIHEAKSLLSKQYDAYQKKGYTVSTKTDIDENQPTQIENVLSQSLQENPNSLNSVSS